MRQISFFIILSFLASFSLLAQKEEVQLYQGSFSTTLSSGGEAKYSYISGPYGKKTFQGSFVYTLRSTRDISKLYQDVKGNYDNNLKDNSWSFKTTFRDYKDETQHYVTGSISLNASYDKGIPHGKWVYNASLKYRDILSQDAGRVKWDKYSSPAVNRIVLMFNQGLLVDSVVVESADYAVIGKLDSKGLLHGLWLIRDGDFQLSNNYDHGYLVFSEKRNLKTNKIDEIITNKDEYNDRLQQIINLRNENPVKLLDLSYRTDTINRISDIAGIIEREIFNNPYLLFKSIQGDKLKFSDINGFKEVVLVNQVTKKEFEQITQIEENTRQLHQVNMSLQKHVMNRTTFQEVDGLLTIVKYYDELGQRYLCMAKSWVKTEDVKKGSQLAENNCKNITKIIDPLPEFKSRGEALEFFLKDSGEKLQVALSHQKKIKENLLP